MCRRVRQGVHAVQRPEGESQTNSWRGVRRRCAVCRCLQRIVSLRRRVATVTRRHHGGTGFDRLPPRHQGQLHRPACRQPVRPR